jgi:hypothetical protein
VDNSVDEIKAPGSGETAGNPERVRDWACQYKLLINIQYVIKSYSERRMDAAFQQGAVPNCA